MTTPFPSPTGYYKVLNEDMTPYHGGRGSWRVGIERRVSGELVPCQNGLHAVTLEQLLIWLGPAIHPVIAVSDERREADDKWVFRSMVIGHAYSTWDDRSQRHFGCDCAEQALAEAKRLGWQDERCDEAVRIARRYADGRADEAALAAAWSAAESAAWASESAARASSAESAAWSAALAAGPAPWSSAREAAEAAESAAWSSARAAESAAAESDAESASRAAQDAAIAWQAKRLARYLRGELPRD